MRDSAPHRLTERRQAILRQTSAALRGQPVILWRVVKGIALAEVASPPNPPRDVIEFDVVAARRPGGGAVGARPTWAEAPRGRGAWPGPRARGASPSPPPTVARAPS